MNKITHSNRPKIAIFGYTSSV